jgi:hypothetical protein
MQNLRRTVIPGMHRFVRIGRRHLDQQAQCAEALTQLATLASVAEKF